MSGLHYGNCLLTVSLLAQAFVSLCTAQKLMRSKLIDGQVHLIGADRAVLNAGEVRTDIPCRVTASQPKLGFDLQFLAGYRVSVPFQALVGDGGRLRILFRVRPLDGSGHAYYFLDRYAVPKISSDTAGNAILGGSYRVGSGSYQVDWMMSNGAGEVCADNWKIETSDVADISGLTHKSIAYTASALTSDFFTEAAPTRRLASGHLMHLRVLMNFTPTDPRDMRLRNYDLENLASILRTILREPQFGTFDLTAFNMQQERVIFEQDAAPRIDFPALGKAVETIEAGTVDFGQLADKTSGIRFLGSLLKRSFSSENSKIDALVILGPKLVLGRRFSFEKPDKGNNFNVPTFHFVYDPTPSAYPWSGAISEALKSRNISEYSITVPKDLTSAMENMLRRLRNDSPEVSVSGK